MEWKYTLHYRDDAVWWEYKISVYQSNGGMVYKTMRSYRYLDVNFIVHFFSKMIYIPPA